MSRMLAHWFDYHERIKMAADLCSSTPTMPYTVGRNRYSFGASVMSLLPDRIWTIFLKEFRIEDIVKQEK